MRGFPVIERKSLATYGWSSGQASFAWDSVLALVVFILHQYLLLATTTGICFLILFNVFDYLIVLFGKIGIFIPLSPLQATASAQLGYSRDTLVLRDWDFHSPSLSTIILWPVV